MKKVLIIFFASFVLLFLIPSIPKAGAAAICDESDPSGTFNPNTPINQKLGLVPCGNAVNASSGPACRCELTHLFVLIVNVYNFIILYIATPLAGLLIVIGGVLLLVSAGNPGLASMAKRIIWGAIIGVLLIFGAWLIINIVLQAIGYAGAWSSPF
ncbi:MAG: hypothetical protein A3C58_01915 [Candidatus Staskawiczbacteria bacterium RIFCSPHIGHO2_02_FULL_34_10]|uniref:DUF4190 domain-containing protein n=2 Tax=Candidatus Staskawicziibacteriota TaxID=1817916 RepID=A0A1G2HJ74_9BACT|nr:MAG: hypothetical protein A2639_02550 [Candidatus Staskawiczbacteria bacterium RIFCSPHIGHO2_01_FULL_34_27]OGZ67493.1 MAG: hypothetical protein A3C58_01915 [Candidatus Staskawiczbacteria bacterium RIFCSPHIGHO2_02_FULL_34_10]